MLDVLNANSEVKQGDVFKLNALVKNTGTQSGDQQVRMDFGNVLQADVFLPEGNVNVKAWIDVRTVDNMQETGDYFVSKTVEIGSGLATVDLILEETIF